MVGMKIVSLLPSATEIVCALGLTEALVGVTHECDYPPDVTGKPVLTASRIHGRGLTSAEIDHAVSTRLGGHQGLYTLDEALLRTLQPDLVLTQELCDVCAVSYTEVQQAARLLDAATRVVSLEPTTLEAVLDNITLVGRLTGRERSGGAGDPFASTPGSRAGAALDGEPSAAGIGLRMAGPTVRGGPLGLGAGGLGRRAGGIRTAGAPVGPDQA
jgi:iron complex transport system substrate-binding protein